MPVIYSNNASTSLSAGINSSVTTIPIASASGFPSIGTGEYYFATIANTANTKIEVVKVTAGTTSLTVTRAQGGTSAQAFDSGDNFQLRVTADTLLAATQTDVKITGGSIATAAIADDAVTAAKLANSINTDIATGVTGNTTANAALPKAGGAMTGAITTNSTFDGRDVAADGVLATNALPKSGGAMTGAITTNSTFDGRDVAADGVLATNAMPKSGGAFTGAVTTNSTIDGRDVAADGVLATNALPKGGGTMTGNIAHAGAFTIDAGNNIVLDNGSTNTVLAYNGAQYGLLTANSNNLIIKSGATTALTFTGANVAVAGTLTADLADNSIDSEHYVDGSIDLAHISSEAVDEDNLYISNAGSNGQFLSKQTGNNGGLTWATVSSEDFIPNGSVMAFFQAAAPSGWTKVTSQNNKVLRVVSGNGGGTGGTWATSSGVTSSEVAAHVHTSAAHTHTGASHSHGGGNFAAANHTLSTAQLASHSHGMVIRNNANTGSSPSVNNQQGHPQGGSERTTSAAGGGGAHSHGMSGNTAAATPGAGGSTTPGNTGSANAHSHTISAPQYIDVIICSKDA